MLKVLMIGPSTTKSKGGMATVIKEIQDDEDMNRQFQIDYYSSFIDGNIFVRFIYSIYAFLVFYFTKRQYDVYHIHLASRGSTFRKGYYIKVAKRWRKKVIAHVHGAQYMEFFDEISLKKKEKVFEILNNADKVIALSEDWKAKFIKSFNLKNCVVVENGINVETYKCSRICNAQTDKSFLCLGRLGKRKGSYDIVDAVSIAAKRDPSIKVFLAGDGEIQEIKDKVNSSQLKSNVYVVGWVDMDEKLSLLSKVSTVLLPSYNEGLPMSILEGMASGKAIISTTVGAIPEVIKEENGVLINPGDISGLADALTLLCGNRILIQRYSENNIKLIEERFSTKIMHKSIMQIYNTL